MDVRRADRSFTEVVADIFNNVQDILRSELRLAQSEVRDDIARARPAAMLVGTAIAAAFLSAAFALLAIWDALSLVMPAWAAALCIAVALALVSAIALASGRKRFRSLSRVTGKGLEESLEWVKEQTR
jgi:uncharacterized membrane protein YqjE